MAINLIERVDDMKKNVLLGVLGGLGPMSTFYFCELLTSHTLASKDSDHVDMLISSRASTPDRTAFILGTSSESPLPVMQEEALRLAKAGADLLVIPCNTAHYFYEGLRQISPVPILNIIEETVLYLKKRNIRTMGLLATDGTVRSRSYHLFCQRHGIECITPTDEEQKIIMEIIYGSVKQNKTPDFSAFLRVSQSLLNRGCECLVLGCTELSLLRREGLNQPWYVDSLEILAYRTILVGGKTPVGFSPDFECLREGTE